MTFGARKVFDSLSCGFPSGRISVILGGSGSGKSTILRLIGGLIHPKSGKILVADEEITNLSERGLYQVRQKLGMMFQGGALLDSYTVFENLALPLRERRTRPPLSEDAIAAEIHSTLQAVGVQDVDALLPGQLSGGMLRRVALARAILRRPLILMCDEPFSGLDPVSIKRIESLLVRINREFGITLIVVSHHIPSTICIWPTTSSSSGSTTAPVEGSPAELRQSKDPEVVDFLDESSLGVSPSAAGGVSTK